MTTLWDTTAAEVVQTLSANRRTAGAVATGLVLTLVVVTDERTAPIAIEAAAAGAAAHPCRLLVVVRRQPEHTESRLDAEVTVGGQLGPGESIVLRMYGPLTHHAESVVLPLLAPDTPVVAWWHGASPSAVGSDPIGRLAARRITDAAAATDTVAALVQRADDYTEGDTDLAWTRTTPWRGLLASAFDTVRVETQRATVEAERGNPSAQLVAAWLRARLQVPVDVDDSPGPGITAVRVQLADGELSISRPDGRAATIERPGQDARIVPLPRRQLGELLGEELRRLDPDEPYAESLVTFAHPEQPPSDRDAVVVRGGTARGGEPADVELPDASRGPSGDTAPDGGGRPDAGRGPSGDTAPDGGGRPDAGRAAGASPTAGAGG